MVVENLKNILLNKLATLKNLSLTPEANSTMQYLASPLCKIKMNVPLGEQKSYSGTVKAGSEPRLISEITDAMT